MSEQLKLTVGVLLMAAGVASYFLIPASQGWMPVLAVLIGLLAGGAVILAGARGQMVSGFVRDAWSETMKVVWPSRKDVLQTTGVIILMVSFMSIFLWLVDFGLLWLVRLIMRQET